MTKEKFAVLLHEISMFDLEEQWVTSDVRQEREEEKWLNVLLRRK